MISYALIEQDESIIIDIFFNPYIQAKLDDNIIIDLKVLIKYHFLSNSKSERIRFDFMVTIISL